MMERRWRGWARSMPWSHHQSGLYYVGENHCWSSGGLDRWGWEFWRGWEGCLGHQTHGCLLKKGAFMGLQRHHGGVQVARWGGRLDRKTGMTRKHLTWAHERHCWRRKHWINEPFLNTSQVPGTPVCSLSFHGSTVPVQQARCCPILPRGDWGSGLSVSFQIKCWKAWQSQDPDLAFTGMELMLSHGAQTLLGELRWP